jgi:hypothetical protein
MLSENKYVEFLNGILTQLKSICIGILIGKGNSKLFEKSIMWNTNLGGI